MAKAASVVTKCFVLKLNVEVLIGMGLLSGEQVGRHEPPVTEQVLG
jgi:hypothetical protein